MDGSRRAIKTSSINHHSVLNRWKIIKDDDDKVFLANCCPTNSEEPLYFIIHGTWDGGAPSVVVFPLWTCANFLSFLSLRLVTGNMGSLTAALFIWLTVIVTPHLTQVRRSSKKQKNISYFATSNTAGHSHSRLRRRPHNTPNRRKHFRMDGYYHRLLC